MKQMNASSVRVIKMKIQHKYLSLPIHPPELLFSLSALKWKNKYMLRLNRQPMKNSYGMFHEKECTTMKLAKHA